jgi:hypothetical protein
LWIRNIETMQALDDLKNEATAAIASAVDVAALEKLRVDLLGKKRPRH